jgi:2-polyprenyl-3-methyl-5-hydroxy-6-metoxy-1,4-benzoquinol methylase
MTKEWTHEESYKYKGIPGIIHRSRLQKILDVFEKVKIGPAGKLADFGCSNGYIIALLKERFFNGGNWNFYGFDHSEPLLVQAREKNLKNCEFHRLELNSINANHWDGAFDIVTCFETLEHVGNYHNALVNLYKFCKPGGKIIFSIPNEKDVPGLIKYFGRKILRRDAYKDFFNEQNEIRYVWHLLLNKPLGEFRKKNLPGWGEHLGFDWKLFEQFINNDFINVGKCRILSRESSFIKFNLIYMLEKLR